MAKLKAARTSQFPLVAYFEFNLDDTMDDINGVTKEFGATGAVFDVTFLPINSVIVGGDVIVEEVSDDTAATHTVDVGDATDPDRYSSTPVDLKSAGRTALTLTGYENSPGENLRLTFSAANEDATTGRARVTVHYIVAGRANEVQTH